jgi:hypothetical protein
MKKPSFKPENNKLDAIIKEARTPKKSKPNINKNEKIS